MKVILHRERVEMGSGSDGPRMAKVWTLQLVTTELVPKYRGKVEQDKEPIDLPYIIWASFEQGRTRFRWARRHRGKPEMRLGISTHGAQESLERAIAACVDNHTARAQLSDT